MTVAQVAEDSGLAEPVVADEPDHSPDVDRGDGAGRIQPKKADEFVCQSCFLVKHRRQLADERGHRGNHDGRQHDAERQHLRHALVRAVVATSRAQAVDEGRHQFGTCWILLRR